MYCPSCGTKTQDNAKYCHVCGNGTVVLEEASAATETVASIKEMAAEKSEFKGVGGWLYYLIGMLVFAIPALSANAILGDFQDAANLMAEIPGFYTAASVDAAMRIILSIASIYCGFMLWKIRPYAIMSTKIFFAAYILYVVFGVLVVTALSNLPPEIEHALELGTAKEMTSGVMFPILWMVYLFRSVRVKNTYKS
ncbi:MAG: DUF2569 family protein [Thiobacillus sp.]|nr:DUF2569 family protein [Thiobacillus sp.]